MTVVVGYLGTPESRSALGHAVRECGAHGDDLVVVTTAAARSHDGGGPALDAWVEEVAASGLAVRVQQADDDHRVAAELVDASYEEQTSLVVVGVRRRSPVGKAVAGSFSQRVILDAHCPVVAVKPPAGSR